MNKIHNRQSNEFKDINLAPEQRNIPSYRPYPDYSMNNNYMSGSYLPIVKNNVESDASSKFLSMNINGRVATNIQLGDFIQENKIEIKHENENEESVEPLKEIEIRKSFPETWLFESLNFGFK